MGNGLGGLKWLTSVKGEDEIGEIQGQELREVTSVMEKEVEMLPYELEKIPLYIFQERFLQVQCLFCTVV